MLIGGMRMPAARRISRYEIIDAAVEVLRDGGISAVNARSVAKKLGCSAQPIYLSFKSMDELKTALTERAIAQHTQRVARPRRVLSGAVLCRLDALFPGRAANRAAEPRVSVRSDAAGRVSGAVLPVRRRLAAEYPCGCRHADLWRGAFDGVGALVSQMNAKSA